MRFLPRFEILDGWRAEAFDFVLDPTPAERRALMSHAGARRKAFNWGLGLVKERLDAQEQVRLAALTEQLSDQEVDRLSKTVVVPWTLPALRKEWNAAKSQVVPWWTECSKEAFSSGLADLAAALKNYSESKRGQRKGRKVGFPRFKSRRRDRLRFRYTTGAFGIASRTAVKLPRIGVVRTHEPTCRLQSLLDAGDARVLSMSVSFRQDRWHAVLACLVCQPTAASAPAGTVVGVDVGVKHLAVLSTGEMVANPRALKEAQRKLRRYQRRLDRQRRASNPDCYDQRGRAIKGRRPARRSKNMLATERQVRRLHARVANTRSDAVHKLTHRLATKHAIVVGEDLSVAGLCRGGNGGLRRAVHDASLGEIHRQIAYKTVWNGGKLVLADRFYPSSKTCSGCGVVKAKLSLSARTYRCEQCGLVLDRDVNAARNLAALVQKMVVAGSGPETQNAMPRPPAGRIENLCKTRPSRRATGRQRIPQPQRHQTGTVTRQRETEKRCCVPQRLLVNADRRGRGVTVLLWEAR
ncbi:MAG: IS607 family element RNA-guided endonuclease TnpB [Solirubrobacteraceae bacterium]